MMEVTNYRLLQLIYLIIIIIYLLLSISLANTYKFNCNLLNYFRPHYDVIFWNVTLQA